MRPFDAFFLETVPPPRLRVWMTTPPPPFLSEALDPPLLYISASWGNYVSVFIPLTSSSSFILSIGKQIMTQFPARPCNQESDYVLKTIP